MSSHTDEEIAALVQRGEPHLFTELVERYEDRMTRYARRFLISGEDLKDAVQEVFIKAYVNIRSFDPTRRFSPWLYRIAHNAFINFGKTLKRLPFFTFDLDALLPHRAAPDRVEDAMEKRELGALIERSLKILDVKYREPLALYYLEDMSYQEIADILAIPAATVGVRIMRGKKMLEQVMKPLV